MSLYLSSLFGWAGVVVAVAALVILCNRVAHWLRIRWIWRDDPRPGYLRVRPVTEGENVRSALGAWDHPATPRQELPQHAPAPSVTSRHIRKIGADGVSRPPLGLATTTARGADGSRVTVLARSRPYDRERDGAA